DLASRRNLILAQVRRDCRYVAPGNLHHAQFIAVQLQGRELPAPDRAGGDGVHAPGEGEAPRGPVATDDLQVALGAAGSGEPGIQAGGLGAGRTLLVDRDAPARGAVTGAGEPVDDRPPAFMAAQARRPVRLVTVHVAQQVAVAVALHLAFDLGRVLFGLL